MRLKIFHSTKYEFDNPINHAMQQIRLTPHTTDSQKVLKWNVKIENGKKELDFVDQHNNMVILASLNSGSSKISITCGGTVETINKLGIVGVHSGYVPLWHFKQPTVATLPGKNIKKLIKPLSTNRSKRDDISYLQMLSEVVADAVPYKNGKTNTETSAEEVIEAGGGVCQDHAHVFISAARLLGFPARYVSGYMLVEAKTEQEASHAWAEIWTESIGWVAFDVSNQIFPDERYVRIATGLDYTSAAPISGIRFGNSKEKINVSIQVKQL